MTVLGHRSPTATSGRSAVGGVSGHAAVVQTVTSEDAFVSRRGDHLGPSLVRRRAMLAFELPQGTTLYVGLFTAMPNRVGQGGTEVSVSGYTRLPIASWITATVGASARRTNAVSLIWEDFATSATLVGWGTWADLTGGVVRDFDFLRTTDLDPVSRVIAAGSNPAFGAGEIGLTL